MKAIHVKILAATEKQPTRFKASGLNLCVVQPMQYDLNSEANAAYAAEELVTRYNAVHHTAKLKLVGTGELPDGSFAVLLAKK